MSDAFAEHGLAIVLAMPFDDDSWPYAAYAKIADYIVLMGYDEHGTKVVLGASPVRVGSRIPSTSA